jgi:hypothetical protein
MKCARRRVHHPRRQPADCVVVESDENVLSLALMHAKRAARERVVTIMDRDQRRALGTM